MPPTLPPYPPEFRAEAIQLARCSAKSIPALAADLGIAVWYNRQRRHTTLGYLVPVAHEEQHLLLLQDQATQR